MIFNADCWIPFHYINQKLNPSPEAKVELGKPLDTTHSKERWISTSTGAMVVFLSKIYIFFQSQSVKLPLQSSRFQAIKKYFKKRIEKGL